MAQDENSITRRLLNIAIPVSLAQAGHIFVGIADSMMVGHFGGEGSEAGKIALAAASLANGLYSVIMVFGFGVIIAVTPAIANAKGKGDVDQIRSVYANGMAISLLLGAGLFLLMYLSSPILNHFDQPTEVVRVAVPYFKIMMLSLVPLMIFTGFRQFAEGLSFTLHATIVTLLSNLVNIGLNYLLIYGKFGLPAMGLEGAGWASLISRVLMAIGMGIVIYRHQKIAPLVSRNILKDIDGKTIKRLIKTGIPIGLQLGFEVSAFAISAIMMGWLGAAPLAAHQIALSLAAVTYMLASGLSSAATVVVGGFAGEQNTPKVAQSGWMAIRLVLIFMSVMGIGFVVLRNILPGLFNYEEIVIVLASELLVVAGLFQISDGLQVVAQGALRGLNDVRIPTLIAFAAYFVVGLPLAWLLAFEFDLGPRGIWFGLLAGLSLSAIMQLKRFQGLVRT